MYSWKIFVRLIYRLTGFGQDFDAIPHADKLEICDSIENFYTEYYDETKDTFNTIGGIPIGAPISLHVEEGLEDTWDFAEFYMERRNRYWKSLIKLEKLVA